MSTPYLFSRCQLWVTILRVLWKSNLSGKTHLHYCLNYWQINISRSLVYEYLYFFFDIKLIELMTLMVLGGILDFAQLCFKMLRMRQIHLEVLQVNSCQFWLRLIWNHSEAVKFVRLVALWSLSRSLLLLTESRTLF
jgi:hypothetical protein